MLERDKIAKVIEFEVNDDVLVERIEERRIDSGLKREMRCQTKLF